MLEPPVRPYRYNPIGTTAEKITTYLKGKICLAVPLHMALLGI
jgi:hypothetical protein